MKQKLQQMTFNKPLNSDDTGLINICIKNYRKPPIHIPFY